MANVINDSNFDELISKNQYVVIDFWAEWCGPCRMIGPIIDELSEEYKGKIYVAKCNVDENPLSTRKYSIMSIPTILFIKNGQVVDKHIGSANKSVFKKKFDELIQK